MVPDRWARPTHADRPRTRPCPRSRHRESVRSRGRRRPGLLRGTAAHCGPPGDHAWVPGPGRWRRERTAACTAPSGRAGASAGRRRRRPEGRPERPDTPSALIGAHASPSGVPASRVLHPESYGPRPVAHSIAPFARPGRCFVCAGPAAPAGRGAGHGPRGDRARCTPPGRRCRFPGATPFPGAVPVLGRGPWSWSRFRDPWPWLSGPVPGAGAGRGPCPPAGRPRSGRPSRARGEGGRGRTRGGAGNAVRFRGRQSVRFRGLRSARPYPCRS